MDVVLSKISEIKNTHIIISGSKSESNRLLLLQALFPQLTIENLSDAADTILMKKALENTSNYIDIHHSGTAMRFLTAYFSAQPDREVILSGSSRMKERPIAVLVNALREMGAEIEYLENEGFPPLKIKGKPLTKNKISVPAHISSQYISALILIAPKLENGLEIILEGKITSLPYIKMSLALLNQIGVQAVFKDNHIKILKSSVLSDKKIIVESDWSSASYFYSIIALSKTGTTVTLSSFKQNSFQADRVLTDIYKYFGVETTFNNDSSVTLTKAQIHRPEILALDLKDSPDIAQTIAVTCFGLGIGCHLHGLHTLKIKETDRLSALKNEIEKLGGKVETTDDSLILKPNHRILESTSVATYQDHRMAMAFAPLALKTSLTIKEAEVVSKSYPKFWEDLQTIGFKITQSEK